MSDPVWDDVEDYICASLLAPDPVLDASLADSEAAGLPAINVSPPHGKLLHLLARAAGARKILEIGTLAGYSAIWMARALPAGGHLITLEIDPRHADVARGNFARAGLSSVIELRLGGALDSLQRLVDAGEGPFDFIFIDADKENNADYFRLALALSRPGTMIVIDNVVRDGKVIDAASRDPMVQGVRRLNEAMAAEPRVSATAIQTVGSKGYDGFAMVLVLA